MKGRWRFCGSALIVGALVGLGSVAVAEAAEAAVVGEKGRAAPLREAREVLVDEVHRASLAMPASAAMPTVTTVMKVAPGAEMAPVTEVTPARALPGGDEAAAHPRLTAGAGLSVAATATATSEAVAEDPNAWAQEDEDEQWAAEHLALSARFAAPFQGERIYPRIALGTSFLIAQGESGGLNQFVGQFDLSLYWVDLHIPYNHMLDGERVPTRIRLDMKVPIPIPLDSASRFALMGGATFSDESPQLIDSLRFQVGWGYGGEVVSFQVRGGYGYRQPFDESAMKQGFLYGATLGFNFGPVQPLLEVDGVRFDDLTGQVEFLPGLRFYPLDTPSLRLGIAGLFTLTHDKGESKLHRRRFGTMFQVSYDFI